MQLDYAIPGSIGTCVCPTCGLEVSVFYEYDPLWECTDIVAECGNGHALEESDIHPTFRESSCV